MAKELTEEEQCGMKDLEENFTEHIERYRIKRITHRESGKKTTEDLQDELNDLEDYLEGCRNSEIDDVIINIEFASAKAGVLRRILGDDENQ
jgi:hypothetical protein